MKGVVSRAKVGLELLGDTPVLSGALLSNEPEMHWNLCRTQEKEGGLVAPFINGRWLMQRLPGLPHFL